MACNIALLAVGLYVSFIIRGALEERDADIVTKREMLARLTAVVALEADVQKTARQLDDNQQEFLSGSNEGVIAADLQTRLKSIAEHNGTRIHTIQGQPAQPGEMVQYIGVQLFLVGKLQNIHHTIYEIENSKPYLFVTSASVKLAASSAQASVSEEPTIEARLDVFGVMPMNRQKP